MIYIAEHESYEEGKHQFNITGKTVSREELDRFFSYFNILGQFHQFKEIYGICEESNIDLRNFLLPQNLNKLLREDHVNGETVLQTGNKLILNYCTVIKMMVEKVESYLTHNQPDKFMEFKEFCSHFYDNDFSYRFFMRLRNHMIHNAMPFTRVKSSLAGNCNIYMSRDDLLKSPKLNAVEEDLRQMESNEIEVQPLLLDIGASMYAIYMRSLYYLAPQVVDALKNFIDFREKYGVENFDFVEYEDIEEFRNGKFKHHVVPSNQLLRCIEELNKSPEINIKINIIHNKI